MPRVQYPILFFPIPPLGGHFLMNARHLNNHFWLVIDSGASRSVFDVRQIEHFCPGIEIMERGEKSQSIGNESLITFSCLLPDIQLDDYYLIHKEEVALMDLSSINDTYKILGIPTVLGIIGADVLINRKINIDFGKKRIRFTEAQ